MEDDFKLNYAKVSGVIIEPIVSFISYGKKLISFSLRVLRSSSLSDIIPIVISEELFNQFKELGEVCIEGKIRTYYKYDGVDGKSHLASQICATSWKPYDGIDYNEVSLTGTVGKVMYRVTPLGRKICDIPLFINDNTNEFNRNILVFTIVWGANARKCSTLPKNTLVNIVGRFQSREYEKLIPNLDKKLVRTVHEISVFKLHIV